MKSNIPLQLRYGGIALIFMGAAAAAISGISMLEARHAQSWPAVDARVVRSDVEVTKKVGGIRRGTAVTTDYYSAAIRYEYRVNGQTFTGSRICHDESNTSGYNRSDVEQWVRKYPVGTTIRIQHSPVQPNLSYIDPRPDTLFLAVVLILGKLTLLGGAVLFRTGKQMQPAEEDAPPIPVPVHAEQAQPIPEPARRTHWLIATVAVMTGLLFFLCGGLSLPFSVKRYAIEMNSSGPDEVNHAVNIVMVVIMASITLFGAFLIWFPLRRPSPPVRIAQS